MAQARVGRQAETRFQTAFLRPRPSLCLEPPGPSYPNTSGMRRALDATMLRPCPARLWRLGPQVVNRAALAAWLGKASKIKDQATISSPEPSRRDTDSVPTGGGTHHDKTSAQIRDKEQLPALPRTAQARDDADHRRPAGTAALAGLFLTKLHVLGWRRRQEHHRGFAPVRQRIR